jgi:hypothetical protein
MSHDELDHLRAILAKTHDKPRKESLFARISRVAKGLFTRPKKADFKRMEKKENKKNAA